VKQVLINRGNVTVEDVPAPVAREGHILVSLRNSCISIGTEMTVVSSSGKSIYKRAMEKPEHVRKVMEMAVGQGISKTVNLIKSKLETGRSTGYSASGIVLEIGQGIKDLSVGDSVAVAGAQCAHHAEVVCIPRNLAVKIPPSVDFEDASTVTLGAIALQGIRRANPTLGESFVVLGLGILGQITSQLLMANGCRVIGYDLDPDRVKLARELGMSYGLNFDDGDVEGTVQRITDRFGADGVIITAATPANSVVSKAFQMCRKKGRVVLVGDVGLNLKREDFYKKELDFFISTSYGPGRYEQNYEDKGLDYPIGYVRWTENRNMEEYLRLIAENKINIKSLVGAVYDIQNADKAYSSLKGEGKKPLMVLLSYPERKGDVTRIVENKLYKPDARTGKIGIAVAGAGGFAKGMHLPNLQKLSHVYTLEAIQSQTGNNAKATARQFGARYATTDFNALLSDRKIAAIVITTRHNLHAKMIMNALHAGKHVLVEKPLSLNQSELNQITDFYNSVNDNKQKPLLLTGFNRRFSKYAVTIKQLLSNRTNPMIINYRMNAGYIPLDFWVHTEEGGGRNIGEGCHIYDLFTYLTESVVKEIQAVSISPSTEYYGKNDNFIGIVSFEDGSVATLTYTALGSRDYPKEQMEIFCDGKVIYMDDYRSLKVSGVQTEPVKSKTQDKGQYEELEAFAKAIREGGEWPIPLWQQIQATEISFEVEKRLSLSE
jgi:predicted dehydrogenase/threonine dehydrogenase-like Zn-dependent dehydrogenase